MNDFIVMPNTINSYNGTYKRCDMAIGPCCCGATHKLSDWNEDIIQSILDIEIEKNIEK